MSGEEKSDRRVVIYMPPSLHEKLEAIARTHRRPISPQVVVMLEKAIAEEAK